MQDLDKKSRFNQLMKMNVKRLFNVLRGVTVNVVGTYSNIRL